MRVGTPRAMVTYAPRRFIRPARTDLTSWPDSTIPDSKDSRNSLSNLALGFTASVVENLVANVPRRSARRDLAYEFFPKLAELRFNLHRMPRRAKAGRNVTQMHYAKKGIVIRTPFKNVSCLGRDTQGVRVMRFKEEGDLVSTVTFV